MRISRVGSVIAFGFAVLAAACTNELAVENPAALQNTTVSAQLIENVRDVPVDAVFFNPCCNEDVHVFGTAHFVLTDDISHTVVSGISGIGLQSGLTYTGRGVSSETNVFYSNQSEGTLSFDLALTSDDGCSLRLKVLLHITVNANGDLASEVENVRVICSR